MRPRAYYNENEPFAAQWLRNLVAAEFVKTVMEVTGDR